MPGAAENHLVFRAAVTPTPHPPKHFIPEAPGDRAVDQLMDKPTSNNVLKSWGFAQLQNVVYCYI